MDIYGIILSAFSITGGIFVAHNKLIGFWLWVFANSGWIIYCSIFKIYTQIPGGYLFIP